MSSNASAGGRRALNALDKLFLRDVDRAGHALPMILALVEGTLDADRVRAALGAVARLVPFCAARLSPDGRAWLYPGPDEARLPLEQLSREGPLDDAAVGDELRSFGELPCDPFAGELFRARLVHGQGRSLFLLRGLHAAGDGMVLAYLADAFMRQLQSEPAPPGIPPALLSDAELLRRMLGKRALVPVAAMAAVPSLLPFTARGSRKSAPPAKPPEPREREGSACYAFGRLEPAVVEALEAAAAKARLSTSAVQMALTARAVSSALAPARSLRWTLATRFFLRQGYPLGNHFTLLDAGLVGASDSLANLATQADLLNTQRLPIAGRYALSSSFGFALRRGVTPAHQGVYTGSAAQVPFRNTPLTVGGHAVVSYGAAQAPNRGEGGTNVFLIQDRQSEGIGVCVCLRGSLERAKAALGAIQLAFASAPAELG